MSDTFDCPRCGVSCKIIPLRDAPGSTRAPGSWQHREMQSFGIAGPGADFDEYERQQPIGKMSMEHNVKVPLVFAVITAALLGLGSWFVVYYNEWPLWIPLVVFFGALIVSWFVATDFAKRLLFISETIIGRDIDSDGHVGEPPREPHRIELEIAKTNDRGHVRGFEFLDLQVEPDALRTFARDVSTGGSLGVHKWGTHFTRREYDTMMDALQRRGYVRDLKGSRGRELTAKGMMVFQELARR